MFSILTQAFEGICQEAGVLALWQSMTEEKRFSLLTRITDQMEVCSADARATASRALLYIAQVSRLLITLSFSSGLNTKKIIVVGGWVNMVVY